MGSMCGICTVKHDPSNPTTTAPTNIFEIKGELHSKIEHAKKTKSFNIDKMNYSNLEILENKEIPNLVLFSAENNRLYSLPTIFFSKQRKLKKLLLANNNFGEFPANLTNNSNIDKMDLSHNLIKSIPAQSLVNFVSLKELNLSHNKLVAISEDFISLFNLEVLDLSFNHIQLFHSFILQMNKLEYLNLKNNEILVLPKTDYKFSKLTTLDVSNNGLTEVPPDLFKNSKISALNLKNNSIKRSDLYNIEGFLDFEERRKGRKDQGFLMNLDINFNLCGLDS